MRDLVRIDEEDETLIEQTGKWWGRHWLAYATGGYGTSLRTECLLKNS